MDQAALKECISKIINLSFSRSSGPGGQNVNKLNTKVTARLRISELYAITDAQKNRVRSKLKNRINDEDELVIQAQDERRQAKNRDLAVQRMVDLIAVSIRKKKKRIPTKPSVEAIEKRLKLKKKRGLLKKLRKKKYEI